MNDIIPSMQWRYATKQYDTAKKVSDVDLAILLEAARLAPSSFGLVTWKMIVVSDPALRAKLREAGFSQPQFTDASHIIVFAAKTAISEADVDEYMRGLAETRGVPIESLSVMAEHVKGAVSGRSPEARTEWATRQAYISLGVLLEAAALMRIDATPMEGFDGAKFDEILGLKEQGLASKVVAAIGYRNDADPYITAAKFRPEKETLVINK